MTFISKQTILENLYFFIPFLCWVIVGGVLLYIYPTATLFFAVNQYHSFSMDIVQTICSAFGRGDVIAILLISLLVVPSFRSKKYVSIFAIFGITVPLCNWLLKQFFNAPRPLKTFPQQHVHTVPWLDNLYAFSFPSGHTLGAFALFLLLSFLLPRNKKEWSFLFFILALSTAYSRLYLGQHFFMDVYVGSILGSCISFIIFVFITWKFNKTSFICT